MTLARKTKEGRAAEIARRKARPDLKQMQDRSRHGRRHTYNYWFCRCPACTRANMRASKTNRLNARKRTQ